MVFAANTGTDKDDIERRHLFQTPIDRAKVTQLTSGAGLEWSPVLTADDRLLFISGTATRPPVPATLAKDGKPKLIAPELVPAKFPMDELVTPKRVTFQSPDGVTVHGQLFVPKKSKGKLPAIVVSARRPAAADGARLAHDGVLLQRLRHQPIPGSIAVSSCWP